MTNATGRLADYRTPADIAAEFGISKETVRRWVREGRLGAVQLAGSNRFLIHRNDVDALVTPVRPVKAAG